MSLVSEVAEKAIPPLNIIHVVKIILATVLIMLLLALGGASWYLYHKFDEASMKNVELNAENSKLKGDIELIKVGQEAMTLGLSMASQQKENLDKKVRETRTILKQKEQQIDKSTASPEEKARRKAEARMSSVWDNFCYIQPSNTICKQRSLQNESNNPQP
jgi:outer membrane murein-binding lipoprotein Lpp